MQNAIAFADNDVVTVAWTYGRQLDGCMGFAVYRVDEAGAETALPAMATFPGVAWHKGQTTADCPVQKFYWKDPYARMAADAGSRKFRYKVVPLQGAPGALAPMPIGSVTSNEVELTPTVAPGLHAYFNRGLISTQHVSQAFGGHPAKGELLKQIADPKNQLRKELAGDMIGALTSFIDGNQADTEFHLALYELGDQQLIDALTALKGRLHLVLSNSSPTDDQKSQGITDGNVDSRKAVHDAGCEVLDRILPHNQIGHNKFAVRVRRGKAEAVLFGSTNWTSTGLCAQTNNTIVCEDEALATRYLEYWTHLRDDTVSADGDAHKLQSSKLRQWDMASQEFDIDGAKATSWFSPNTLHLRNARHDATEAFPPDMQQVSDLIAGAEQAVIFLCFEPGVPSVVDWIAKLQLAKPQVFVRGCLTNADAAGRFYYDLKGTEPPKRQKGDPPAPQDSKVISAKALGSDVPQGWLQELLTAGNAVVHDKIVVIDPFSDNCVVMTGSHNDGFKASYDNDENLVIFQGQKALARAYMTHVLDVYDHFSWRWYLSHGGDTTATLSTDPAKWQSWYFDANGDVTSAQLKFWLSAIKSQGNQ